MKVGTIVERDGQVAYKVEQPVYKDGEKTSETEMVPYVYIQHDKTVKPKKLDTRFLRAVKKQWGSNPKDWKNKKVVAKYLEAFGKEYLSYVPEGKLS